MKILEEEKTFGIDRAAAPAMGGEREIRSGVVDNFIDGRDELRAPQRRLQSRDEQPVIAASLAAADRAGSVSTDSIGDMQLARFSNSKIASNRASRMTLCVLSAWSLSGTRYRCQSIVTQFK